MKREIKFIICVGGNLYPVPVDDPNIEHNSTVIIEDENQTRRICLGLERDDKLSRPYQPYFSRVLTKKKMIELRDELTKLIEI